MEFGAALVRQRRVSTLEARHQIKTRQTRAGEMGQRSIDGSNETYLDVSNKMAASGRKKEAERGGWLQRDVATCGTAAVVRNMGATASPAIFYSSSGDAGTFILREKFNAKLNSEKYEEMINF